MNQRIRIVYLVDSIEDQTHGTVQHVRRLTQALDRNDFFPHLLVMNDPPSEERVKGFTCRVERLGYRSRNPILALRARLRMQRYLRAHQCEIVCAYDSVARMDGLPIARSVHNGLCISVARDMGFNLLPNDLIRLRRSNEVVHRFIASSAAAAQRLMNQEQVFRDWIDIIPGAAILESGISRTDEAFVEARHSFGFSVHQPIVLVHGAFEPWTDRPTVFEALEFLTEHHPDVRFVLLGRPSPVVLDTVNAEAQRRALSRHIVIADDPLLFNQWLLAANVGMSVSLYEGAADALLQFMAAGLPVVATATGDNTEVISHGLTGYLVEAREADALAMRLHLLFVADDITRDFVAAARESVRNEFSDELEVKRFSDYYRTLVFSQLGTQRQIY